jgi:hypothetical protein
LAKVWYSVSTVSCVESLFTHNLIAAISNLLAHELICPVFTLVIRFVHQAWYNERHFSDGSAVDESVSGCFEKYFDDVCLRS